MLGAMALLAPFAFLAHGHLPTTIGLGRADAPRMAIPPQVAELIPEAVRELDATEANWNALLACYPTEEAAKEAVRTNVALVVPYGFDAGNRARNIAGSYKVLQEMLDDDDEVLELITKNPGVLG